MRHSRILTAFFYAACLGASFMLGARPARAQFSILEFPIGAPSSPFLCSSAHDSRTPNSPLYGARGPNKKPRADDGNVWFSDEGSFVGRCTPTGTITKFNTDFPKGIVFGPDGNYWYTTQRNFIGRILVADGTVTTFTVPSEGTGTRGITAGADGNLWFTESRNRVGRCTPSGTITMFDVGTQLIDYQLNEGITSGPDGNIWVTSPGTNQLIRITTAGVVTRFNISIANSGCTGITRATDGNLWFCAPGTNQIVRYVLGTDTYTAFNIPTENSGANNICCGPDGNLYITLSNANKILIMSIASTGPAPGRKARATGDMQELTVPTANSFPHGITNGPDGIYFTEEFRAKIGKIVGPQADVKLTKTASEQSVSVGGNITYTLTASNLGPSDATGVKVIDTLPNGVSLVSSSPQVSSQNGQQLTFNLGTLPGPGVGITSPGKKRTRDVTITIVVRANQAGNATNFATISAVEKDPATGNNTASAATTINAAPAIDLQMTKTASVSSARVGESFTYTVTVRNNGPGIATGVEVWDTLPSQVALVDSTPAVTRIENGEHIFAIGTLASGATSTITLEVVGVTTGNALNSVIAFADQNDSNTNNDVAEVTTTINPTLSFNLILTKSAPQTVLRGDNIEYLLTVTNAGPDSAQNVKIVDNLPQNVTFVSSSPAASSQQGLALTYNVGTLAKDASRAFTIVVKTSTTGNVTNFATVTANELSNGKTTSVTTTVESPKADLQITKTANVATINQGSDITYTLSVRNNGPAAATGATVTDTLPAGLAFVSSNPAPSSRIGQVGTYNLGTIASGATRTITLVARANSPGARTNSASVSGNETDVTSSNNTATASVTVRAVANLGITKTASAATIDRNGTVVFTLTARNNGPSAATNVVVTDTLPAGLTFVSATPTPTSNNNGVLKFNVGSLASGATATINVTARGTAIGTFTNQASIAGSEADNVAGNNSATAAVTVDPLADLALTKTASVNSTTQGREFTYTLTVRNNGPDGATGVLVRDTLPSQLSLVSTTPQPSAQQGPALTFDLGNIDANATKTVTIRVRANGLGQVTNSATCSGSDTDPSSSNNTGTAVVTINAATSDLAITKTASAARVTVGQEFTYTLTVANRGPDSAAGVRVNDNLPGTLAFVSASPAPASSAQGQLVFNVGTLAVNGTATIVVRVRANTAVQIANSATVSGTNSDNVSENNRATATVEATPARSDMSITKQAAASIAAGGRLVYTITVRNNGPDAASNVTVTDALPAGLSFASSTPQPTTRTGNVLTFNVGSLANGATATISISALTSSLGSVTNGATVSAGQTDPVSENNTATASTAVRAPNVTIAITQSVSASSVAVGQNITFQMQVCNTGADPATGVTITDPLPAGVAFVSSNPQPTGRNGNMLTYDVGDLAPNQCVTVPIVVSALASGSFTNVVTARSNQTAPVPATSTANAAITIVPAGGNVTNQVSIARGGLFPLGPYLPTLFTGPPHFGQVVTVTNTGNTAINGPITFILDGLSRGVVLHNAAGYTTDVEMPRAPFINMNLGDRILGPGEQVTFTLDFETRVGSAISYTPRLIAGPGTR